MAQPPVCRPLRRATSHAPHHLSRAFRLLCATTLALALLAAPAHAARHAVHAALRADRARRHRRGGQHAHDLPGQRPPAAATAPRAATRCNNNSYDMALRRRRRRRDHVRLVVGHRLAPGRLHRAVGRPLLGRRHDRGHGVASPPRPPRAATPCSLKVPAPARYQTRHGHGRRRPHLDLAGDPLPRLQRRHRAAGGRRQRHLHGRQRPGRHRPRPLRRLGAVHRLPRQQRSRSAACNVYDGLGTRRRDAHLPDDDRAVPHAGSGAGDDQGRAAQPSRATPASPTRRRRSTAPPLTDARNPADNAMNSTIESGGAHFTAKSPNYVNQLGMDLDVFPQPRRAGQRPELGVAALQLYQRVLHAVGLLPRLRRGAGDEHRRRPERSAPRPAAARRTTARR